MSRGGRPFTRDPGSEHGELVNAACPRSREVDASCRAFLARLAVAWPGMLLTRIPGMRLVAGAHRDRRAGADRPSSLSTPGSLISNREDGDPERSIRLVTH